MATPPALAPVVATTLNNNASSLVHSSAALAIGLASATYDTAAGLLAHGRSGVLALTGALGQMAWEASYMMGVNRSKALNPPVADPAAVHVVADPPPKAAAVPVALPSAPIPPPPAPAVAAQQDPVR